MITKRYKLILWGIGIEYNAHINLLRYQESLDIIDVVAVTANEVPNYHKLDGWRIINKIEIVNFDFDYIVVFNENSFHEIILDIVGLGIERRKVLTGKILDIPYFSWDKYLEIYQSELTIISSNCWGGVICKTLGMECCSPFKNLWVNPEDLCSNYNNLKEILKQEPRCIGWDRDSHSHHKYPIGRIGTMDLHFNHDTVFSEAIEKWNRRVKKVNYNNLFLEIYSDNKEVVNMFLDLVKNGANGVCFVPYGLDCDSNNEKVYELKLLPKQTEFYEVVNSNAAYGRNGFVYDILDMLLGKKTYRVVD